MYWRPEAYNEYNDSMKGRPLEDGHAFAGIPEIQKLEDKYLPKEEIKQRLTAPIGAQYKKGY